MIRLITAALLLGLFTIAVVILVKPAPEIIPPPYQHTTFSQLNGWNDDDHAMALKSFQISCERLLKYPDDRSQNDFGVAADWKPICRASLEIDPVAAKKFFEEHFTPLSFRDQEPGLFTGYYAPLYKGSRTRTDEYTAPLYMVPSDLQAINLGEFDQSLNGRSIVGEIKDNKFVPYKDRKTIELGALQNQQLELVWLKNPEEAFFLQIQGSGFIELENGEIAHFGYAQRNGRPYRAIGQFLIQSGDINREDMSLQSILDWMENNPEKSDELMWKNPSYVFFQERDEDRPVGSLGVGLTPGRSLAVDRSYIPLGAPLWLETAIETSTQTGEKKLTPHLNRLVVAQDTGGAIKGQVRGDVYWGIGDQAELKAGPMKDIGTYYILVPNSVVRKLFAPEASEI